MAKGMLCRGEAVLTAKPELKTVGQATLAVVTLVFHRSYKDGKGEWQEEPTFIQTKAWGRQADGLGKLDKGALIYAEGLVSQENWEKDGRKQSRLVLRLDSFHGIDRGNRGNGNGNGNSEGGTERSANGPGEGPPVNRQKSDSQSDDSAGDDSFTPADLPF